MSSFKVQVFSFKPMEKIKSLIFAAWIALVERVATWLQGITPEQLAAAQTLVLEAEMAIPEAGQGEAKKARVKAMLTAKWRELKPVVLNLLIELAVALVRKKLAA